MKKILKSTGFLIAAIYLPQVSFAGQAVAAYQNPQGASFQQGQAVGSDDPTAAQSDKLSQELERNKELLEIWKDHVRTLTKERDDAYKQIEDLKSNTSAQTQASPAPAETDNEEYLKTIDDLKAQLNTLLSENQNLKTALTAAKTQGADASLKAKLSELQAENEKLKLSIKGLQESQADRDVLIRDKQEALQKIDDMTKEINGLRLENQTLKANPAPAVVQPDAAQDQKIQSMQNAYDELETSFKEQQDKIRKLQAEKLEDKTKIQELKTQVLKLQSGSESQTNAQAEELVEAKATIEQLRSEKDKSLAQITDLNAKVQTLETDRQATRTVVDELSKLKAEREQSKKSYTALDSNYRTQAERLKELQSENMQSAAVKQQLATALTEKQALEKDNAGLENEKQNLNVKIQSLKSDLDQLRTENQKAEGLKAQLNGTLADKEALQKSYAALQAGSASLEQKLKEYSAKVGELDRDNIQLRTENKKVSQQNQSLQANLQANLSDIQNLKSNFDSYLESLEQSFSERQKNSPETAPSR